MADGSSRAIAALVVGDTVLGPDRQINGIMSIQLPRLGQRPLYALEGSDCFVTASHPFLTDDGWKSLDPGATAREYGALRVGQLRVGDRVRLLSGVLLPVGSGHALAGAPVEIDVAPTVIEHIEHVHADPLTQLYNLQLDGNHTYFANDLLVHNK